MDGLYNINVCFTSPTSITRVHVPSESEVVAHAPPLQWRADYMSSVTTDTGPHRCGASLLQAFSREGRRK